jgi:hypothetical protein
MQPTKSSIHLLFALTLFCFSAGSSQLLRPSAYLLESGTTVPLVPSNSISHLLAIDSTVWIGTGKGLARTKTGGATWESFAGLSQFANPSIFSVAVRGDTIWTSTGYNKETDAGSVQTGSGYAYSLDNGMSWNGLPQAMDGQFDTAGVYGVNMIHFLPVTVPEQNVTFDVSLTGRIVWIASWSSGIRSSTDMGRTWHRTVLPGYGRSRIAPTDSLGSYLMNPTDDLNFLGFSVYAQTDSVIWAGTAGGINESTDGGLSWTNMNVLNQVEHIAANWVIAIDGQQLQTGTRIWITNWPTTVEGEQYGISYTDDGGRIWQRTLPGVKTYGFAFKDTIVYVASDDGLYRSEDAGKHWLLSGTIIDPLNQNQIASTVFYAVGILGDTVYGATADGFVTTIDNASHPFGSAWRVLRAYKPLGSTGSTYAYPNPFSPRSDVTRFHYNSGTQGGAVTVELFDFGMNRVRTVVKDAQRPPGDHDEIWDGTTGSGRIVANGVYFYRIIAKMSDGSQTAESIGKLAVVR